jgi:hypothetical protein
MLWAAGKLFWYRQRDFLFLIQKFSGGKLKQKGFFHSVVTSRLGTGNSRTFFYGVFTLSATVSVPSSELAPPSPLPQASVSLPRNQRGWKNARLQVKGWGSPNSDDWRKNLALCACTLWLWLNSKYLFTRGPPKSCR